MSAIADDHTEAGLHLARLRRLARDRDGLWRSFEDLADTPEFHAFLDAEFPTLADMRLDRRTVMKLMGASIALAGAVGCSEVERIVPYVEQPENLVPGKARYYATSLANQGFGIGALVESHEGRPTKVEGNPDHPASLGATDAVMQSAVLELFDPDRARTLRKNDAPAAYEDFLRDVAALRDRLSADRGASAALLVEPSTSPTLAAQIADLRRQFPRLRVFRHAPLAAPGAGDAARHLYGRPLMPVYRFDRARVILSLDGDFLGEGPGKLAYARQFADARRVRTPSDTMSRLYAVESTPTITGAVADHHQAVRPSAVEDVAAALHAKLQGGALPRDLPLPPGWMETMAEDLQAAGREALVVPGEHQSAFVHGVALAANQHLGALEHTVDLIEPPDAMETDGDLADLCEAIEAGETDTLLSFAVDPLRTALADLDVETCFSRLSLLVHWSLYRDDAARLAHWHLPAAHTLESWSDLRAFDGTQSVVQPLILPLFRGKTAHEVLAALAGNYDLSSHEIVRGRWAEALNDDAWMQALRSGVVEGTAAEPVSARSDRSLAPLRTSRPSRGGLELRFTCDPFLRDGRHANSAWLQELPRPLTKIVWGNAALVSPATADRYRLANRQAARIAYRQHEMQTPIWIVPGHPDDTVTLILGHGLYAAGSVAAQSIGHDVYALRTGEAPWLAPGAEIEPLDTTLPVLTTQHHQAMEGRHLVRHATLEEFSTNPGSVSPKPPPEESLYREWEYPHESWGMSIDQTACIGCMACVAACQAENNIATVGPEECSRGHEMHWLRVDRYYSGPPDTPETHFQPVPCMHCEKAPCEPVCPVNATVHTHDGLNAQIYNRCIGTRYCSQNCPYKVRRFNFFDYQPFDEEEAGLQQAMRNPDVSVRSRGVMEKCTYCVQRINEARIEAKIDGLPIADGDVVTACQQACPTHAITFGNLNDPGAKVVAEKNSPLDYTLLAELNTRPRTSYLVELKNPNTRLAAANTPDDADG